MILGYIEFIIKLIHIIILSTIYSAILLILLLLAVKVLKSSLTLGIKNQKFKLWISIAFILFIMLSSYRFSYGRDDGFGETLQVPVGYGQHVFLADDQFVYFYPVEDDISNTFDIGNFIVKGNKLCAEVSHEYSSVTPEHDYIVFNLETRKIILFDSIAKYTEYAKSNGLPLSDKFRNFAYHYKKFIAKPEWKKWLLP